MVQPKKGRRLGGSGTHQKAIIKNLAISLIENGKIETTTARAKFLRMFVDKIITISKKHSGNNHLLCNNYILSIQRSALNQNQVLQNPGF